MRTLIVALTFLGCACHLAGTALGQEKPAFARKTLTYKRVGDLKLQAEVLRAEDTKVRPVLVYIHGGALIMGNRNAIPRRLQEMCAAEGFALVSIDYRLAPEVKLPDIITDLEDALRWVREEGPKLIHIDPEHIVVTGESAGGYLTLMTGFRLKQRPRALLAYWGYGDVDGPWYTKPSEHYRKQKLVEKEDACNQVGGKVVTGTEPDLKARGRFYLYLRQNGLWTREVTGFDPETERAKLDPYCPVRNVTSGYPPTMLVHGTEDTDVPYELSAAVAKELARNKVVHELVTVPGAGHGLSGGDKKLVEAAHAKALAFLRGQLSGQAEKQSGETAEKPFKATKASDYYPLKVGNKWYYRGELNGAQQINLVNRVAKIETIDNEKLARIENCLPNGAVTSSEHLSADDRGIYRHRFNGAEIMPPLCLLKFPVKVGESWEVKPKTAGMEMRVTCRVGREKVEVPAGKYTAIKVHIETEIADMKISTTYWFAAGVGIVKQVANLAGNHIAIELEKFEPGK